MMTAAEIIALLELTPHPGGGHHREIFRDPREVDGQSMGVTAYLLLAAGEVSAWHRVEATELWQYYDGAPLELQIAGAVTVTATVGPGLTGDQQPQLAVPAGAWRTARSLGPWTLIGTTVAPGLNLGGAFALAPEDWSPV